MQKTALVTGATRGIGQAIAARLKADGHEVIGIARHAAVGTGPLDHFYRCDLADAQATHATLATIAQRHRVTVVVNNAGAVAVEPAGAITEAGLALQWQVNVGAAIAAVQAALPGMRQAGWGRIVNIASGAVLGKPGRSGYAGTKAALIGVTRTLALELGPHGITVNCIAPGQIHTDMWAANNDPASDKTQAMVAGIPARRLGAPQDVAAAVAFMACADAGYINGQVLYVCGGLTVGKSPV